MDECKPLALGDHEQASDAVATRDTDTHTQLAAAAAAQPSASKWPVQLGAMPRKPAQQLVLKIGWCRLTLSNPR